MRKFRRRYKSQPKRHTLKQLINQQISATNRLRIFKKLRAMRSDLDNQRIIRNVRLEIDGDTEHYE